MQLPILPSTSYAHGLASASEMAEFDAETIATKVPGLELMERAGTAVFEVMRKRFKAELKKPVSILCGPGNNGGDGLVLARLLKRVGTKVHAVLVGSNKYSPDLIVQIKSFAKIKGQLSVYPKLSEKSGVSAKSISQEELEKLLRQSSLVIDAMLGTGQEDAPRGNLKDMLLALRNITDATTCPKVICIDTPSGVNTDTGKVFEPSVRANLTICIELIKRGLVQYPARENCGEIEVVSIGIDCSKGAEYSFVTKPSTSFMRSANTHKGNYGHVLVLAGSRNMPGAAKLSALAALRSGAGLVTQAELSSCYQHAIPEVLLAVMQDRQGIFEIEMLQQLEPFILRANALLVGPGLGTNAGTAELVLELLKRFRMPTVVDADALNILSQNSALDLSHCILTPHPGEMARLLHLSNPVVQADRYLAVSALAERYSCVAVLKGASSITYHDARGYVNSSGNPYMATGGSGDVLSGTIASFLAQGQNLVQAAVNGVYIHGRAGDLALAQRKGPIIASDIIEKLGEAIGAAAT